MQFYNIIMVSSFAREKRYKKRQIKIVERGNYTLCEPQHDDWVVIAIAILTLLVSDVKPKV